MLVDDGEDTVISLGQGEVYNEVHCDGFPNSLWNFVGFEWYFYWGVYLGCLTSSTSLDVRFDEFCDSWPPEFSRDEFNGLPLSRVAHEVVVELLRNFTLQVVIVRHIYQSFVKDEAVFIVPLL